MLSHQLIHLMEEHWQGITSGVIQAIRQRPETPHVAKLPQGEMESWGRDLLRNLGTWLDGRDEEIGRRYELVGALRFHESVPAAEFVFTLHILKNRLIVFAREHGFYASAVEIYAEEELEYRIGLFFDHLVYHLVKGYERELRAAAHLAAA